MGTMRKIFMSALIIAALAGWSGAQSTPEPSNAPPQETAASPNSATQAQGSSSFPAGTIIPVELSKSLDAKKAKAGDKIEAKIPADLLSKGKIVIPRNAKVIGHVADAKAHSKESPDSRVSIAFDQIVLKDGREIPLQVVVQAIARPLQPAVASDTHMNEGAGMPSGSPSTAGGSGMGASVPSRTTERVASIPTDAGSNSPPPTTVAPLGPTSQGVVGMKGLSLDSSGQASVVSSQTDNVHLDSGTQLILRTQ
jgi:hypothetical protein